MCVCVCVCVTAQYVCVCVCDCAVCVCVCVFKNSEQRGGPAFEFSVLVLNLTEYQLLQ